MKYNERGQLLMDIANTNCGWLVKTMLLLIAIINPNYFTKSSNLPEVTIDPVYDLSGPSLKESDGWSVFCEDDN